MVDPLTGTASRKQFDQTLDAEMQHAMRTGEPFTLLLLSLDGVGDIRNGFGPASADAALREVSARMLRQVRLGDVLCRLSGEEFGVVMRHGAEAAAEVLAARIVEAVREPLTLDSGDAVGVRVCIGIAAYSDDVESVAALTGHAEQALQQARRQHEQRWNFFGRKFEAPALRLVAGDATAVGDDRPCRWRLSRPGGRAATIRAHPSWGQPVDASTPQPRQRRRTDRALPRAAGAQPARARLRQADARPLSRPARRTSSASRCAA